MADGAVLTTGTPSAPVERPRVTLVGTTLVASACGMLFAGLLGTYLNLRASVLATGEPWFTDVTMKLPSASIVAVTLGMSAIAAHWALWSFNHRDRRNGYVALALVLALGVASINSVIYNWTQMGFVIDGQVQAVLVYTITGAHMAMLVAAMAFVGLMGIRALGGQFHAGQNDALAASVLFWDAMVVAYLVIWYAIYVTR